MKYFINKKLIKENMIKNNFTIKSLCKEATISTSTFNRILKNNNCSLMSLYKIAKALKIQLCQMVISIK